MVGHIHFLFAFYILIIIETQIYVHWNEESQMYCDIGVDDDGAVIPLVPWTTQTDA